MIIIQFTPRHHMDAIRVHNTQEWSTVHLKRTSPTTVEYDGVVHHLDQCPEDGVELYQHYSMSPDTSVNGRLVTLPCMVTGVTDIKHMRELWGAWTCASVNPDPPPIKRITHVSKLVMKEGSVTKKSRGVVVAPKPSVPECNEDEDENEDDDVLMSDDASDMDDDEDDDEDDVIVEEDI